jgi:restriction system protein
VGALAGKNATRGIFITTSYFTKTARTYAEGQHVVLVDGNQLADLMVDNSIGVRTIQSFDVKRVDLDFFASADLEAS